MAYRNYTCIQITIDTMDKIKTTKVSFYTVTYNTQVIVH